MPKISDSMLTYLDRYKDDRLRLEVIKSQCETRIFEFQIEIRKLNKQILERKAIVEMTANLIRTIGAKQE